MIRRTWLTILLLAGQSAMGQADTRTIRDWTATCSEETCLAETIGRGGTAMGGANYKLTVGRHDGEGTHWFVRFVMTKVPKPKSGGEISVAINSNAPVIFSGDDGYLADADGMTFGLAGSEDLTALFGRLRTGKTASLSFTGEDGQAHKEDFSLSGLAAALLFIDEQQKRVGKSVGVESPSGVAGEAEFTATSDVAKKLEALAETHCEAKDGPRDIESFHLPGGDALHQLACSSGAYNFSTFFVLETKDEMTPIYFADYSDETGWVGADQLFNIQYDALTGSLSSFYKGRGVGDCGSAGSWIWNTYTFRMIAFRATDACDGKGSEEWPIIYSSPN